MQDDPLKITGETSKVRSDKRKQREERGEREKREKRREIKRKGEKKREIKRKGEKKREIVAAAAAAAAKTYGYTLQYNTVQYSNYNRPLSL